MAAIASVVLVLWPGLVGAVIVGLLIYLSLRGTGGSGLQWRAERMKAIIYERYGAPDVLELRDVDRPVVTDDGVLVRVRAASINPVDWHFMRGEPLIARAAFGPFKPKERFLGVDVAGEVEAVGKNVTRFHTGDEVFGSCNGALAEYACAGEDGFVLKPAGLTFEQAAAVPVAAVTALQALRDHGHVQPGQKVLINGASGGVGTFPCRLPRRSGRS